MVALCEKKYSGVRSAQILYAPTARPIIRRCAPPSSRRRLSRKRFAHFLCRQSQRASGASDYNIICALRILGAEGADITRIVPEGHTS